MKILSGLLATLLLVCGLSAPALAGALPPTHKRFHLYGSESGLETLTMWSMIKDRHGLLWLGLEQTGVAVFDGFRFRLYGLADGLASGDVQALFEDADGQIWAGTGKGLALWNGKGFTRVTDGIPDAQVNAIQAGPGGTLWVATAAGLYKRVSGLKFAPVEGWPGGEATALHAARDGKT